MRVVDLMEQSPSSTDERALWSVSNLEKLLARQGDLEGAEKLIRRAIDGFQRLGKSRSIVTLTVELDLQLILWKRGRFDESLVIMEECVKTASEIYGDEHPHTIQLIILMSKLRSRMAPPENAEEE